MLDQIRALAAGPAGDAARACRAELVADWIAADGRARHPGLPRGNSNDEASLHRFVAGGPAGRARRDRRADLASSEAGGTVVGAFLEAGPAPFVAITHAAGRWCCGGSRDVLLTMAPIVLTGLLTFGHLRASSASR